MSKFDPSATFTEARDSRPTRVRHVVVFVAILMSIILYLDRYCVSFSERYIKEDLALSESQMGWFISAFFWTYALAQVPAGWLGDRLGSRGVLVLYIVSWSFFTAMIGLAAGFIMLLAMRLGCGLAQAGAYPTAGSLLSRWVPFSRRGFASGLVALGGRTGAVIAPLLTAYLMVVFVPLSIPGELDNAAILNGPALCGRLLPPNNVDLASEKTAAEHRLISFLPDDAQWVVVRYGNLVHSYAQAARQLAADVRRSAEQKPAAIIEKPDQRGIPARLDDLHCDPQDLTVLVAGLNTLLKNPELFSDDDFSRLNMEREARKFLERRQRGETFSAEEIVRFNRLVLEAMFPNEIGKLYVQGWRPVLFVYGIAGLVVAAIFWVCFRNSPGEHPRCNAAEKSLIAVGGLLQPAAPEANAKAFPAQRFCAAAACGCHRSRSSAPTLAGCFWSRRCRPT